MSTDHHQQPLPPPPTGATNTLSLMNSTLLDPPRWGWTAAGSIADLLPSHERARRKRARTSYLAEKRMRERDPRNQQEVNVSLANLETVPVAAGELKPREQGSENHTTVPRNMSDAKDRLEEEAERVDDENDEPKMNSSATLPTIDDSTQDPSQLSGDILLARKRQDFEQIETQQHDIVAFKNIMSELSERSDKSNNVVKNGTIHPSALSDAGVLDMFTYHRGREGQEPRNSATGELICDVEPTDTSYGLTEPKLKVIVTVEFPLEDAEECTKDFRLPSHETLAYYKENVEWDLSKTTTESPMEYSLQVAEEFGLSFGQTVDLAVSIQNQIDDFLRGHITYSPPITIRDPSGMEREPRKPAAFSLQLYGSASGQQQHSGFPLSRKQRAASRSVYSSKAIGSKTKPAPEDESGAEMLKSVSPRFGYFESLPIEEEYTEEVKKMARAQSEEGIRQQLPESGNEPVAVIKILDSGNCHVCHKRCANVAQFPCLISTHIYCPQHCKSKLGITLPESIDQPPQEIDYCPICSFSCHCIQCRRRLCATARELKKKREGTAIDDVVVDNGDVRSSLRTRTHVLETRRSGKPGPRQGHKDRFARGVPKVPASDFPREVCGGLDLDPGKPADYLTVHTSEGSFRQSAVQDESPAALAFSSEPSVLEDGNVDYCQQCRIPGNLLCCDFCPRAYHPTCLVDPDTQVNTPWECPACLKEKGGLADDLITGQTSLSRICAAFTTYEDRNGLQILSIIHEMVIKLIDYDFGETFREPVDLMIIGYKEMIKNPMDLGTIRDNLVDGTYQNRPSASGQWDDVILDVLRDVELVWHNCFTFNREGSAIYRMADVLRRRSLKIREASFEDLLTEKVRAELAKYVSSCEAERGRTVRAAEATMHSQTQHRGNARYKITVKWQKGGLSRPVAVLDPDSGYVVKIYSTMRAAGIAAAFLSDNLRHPCEWKTLSDVSVKGIIHRSAADSNVRLFGYRWLLLDELRARNVRFPKTNKKRIVEIVDESGAYIFQSVEDALSYSHLPRSISVASLRSQLLQLAPGPQFTSLAGRSFRILIDKNLSTNSAGESSSVFAETDISLKPFCQPVSSLNDQESTQVPNNVTIVKEDIVARRKLAGFESIRSAYLDWVRTFDGSPATLKCELRTEAHFHEYYLDGDRNVDGIVWKSLKQSPKEIMVESDAIVGKEAADSMDCALLIKATGSQADLHGGESSETIVSEEPVDSVNGKLSIKSSKSPLVKQVEESVGGKELCDSVVDKLLVNSSTSPTGMHVDESAIDIVGKEPGDSVAGKLPTGMQANDSDDFENDNIALNGLMQFKGTFVSGGSAQSPETECVNIPEAGDVQLPQTEGVAGAFERRNARVDERPDLNGFLQENQSSLHFLAQVSELEESFPTSLSKAENLGSQTNTTPDKLGTYENFSTELLQPRQTVQIAARPSDSSEVQTIIKTFRQ